MTWSIEKGLSRVGGRKFLVVTTATVLVCFGKITSGDWKEVAMVYMVANALAKIPNLGGIADKLRDLVARVTGGGPSTPPAEG
ncbi:MAG TPA: hypothetical protein GXX28_05595 [Firmicutes bacterium]|nr:hypothetical protein [Bacillota bacterium]